MEKSVSLPTPASNINLSATTTTVLKNRKGYDENFLGTILSLPSLAAADKNNLPKLLEDPGTHEDQALDYTHFSVLFNKEKKLPFYTAVNINGLTNLAGKSHESRGSDTWLPDYRITDTDKNTFQYANNDYRNSGFQRGHMVRYFDPAWGASMKIDETAMGDTFHYTNACPRFPIIIASSGTISKIIIWHAPSSRIINLRFSPGRYLIKRNK